MSFASAEPSSTRATWGASRPGRRRSPRGSEDWPRPAPSTIRSLSGRWQSRWR